jgi:hypothetical protein
MSTSARHSGARSRYRCVNLTDVTTVTIRSIATRRALLAGVAAALAVMVALPMSSQAKAAPTKTKALYFDNLGDASASGCSQDYVLVAKPSYGHPCGDLMAVAQGNGYTYTHEYGTVRAATGFRISTARHLTGTVYLAAYPYVDVHTGSGPVVGTMAGPLGAKITVYVNNSDIGTTSGTGVATPGGTVAIPIDLVLPTGLNGRIAKSVIVDLEYTDGVGVVCVSYAHGSQSRLVFATR